MHESACSIREEKKHRECSIRQVTSLVICVYIYFFYKEGLFVMAKQLSIV